MEGDLLVFPAASRPSMSRRISRDPKILLMILETEPPIVVGWMAWDYSDSRLLCCNDLDLLLLL